ncbi:MAG: hypothetical protein PHF56_22535 [Desulfuromonadaceae bacterium]|nr:hypothetical protein [Desulfuromonadaceae bacterium]
MFDKILLVSDGIIVIAADTFTLSDNHDMAISLHVQEHGADLRISNSVIKLPVAVLEHLERAEGTNVYFYQSTPYAIIAPFVGGIEIRRDELLKIKGAWEYSYAPS